MGSCAAALARLCDPAAEVSAHYLIANSGRVHTLVPEDRRAWHAGAGAWGPISDVNSHSIGIEMDNPGTRPFSAPQMAALARLLRDIMTRWQIAPERIIAHSDMAPNRKSDPGPRFDWRGLARAGLSVWPVPMPPVPPDPARFRAALRRFGYPDADDDLLLHAFRLRFRPQATGPLSGADMAAAQNLAARFAVDPPRPNA
jgi:N-acetylmuramoyl-L-alanine amidase